MYPLIVKNSICSTSGLKRVIICFCHLQSLPLFSVFFNLKKYQACPLVSRQASTTFQTGIFEYHQGFFFAILGRGPRAFQIGKISAVNHYFGKFSKQTRAAFLVSLKTKLAITHTIAIKLKENRMQF